MPLLWNVLTKTPQFLISEQISRPRFRPKAVVFTPVKTSSKARQESRQEVWGRERNFKFLIISQKKEMPVKSEKQQYHIKYIQRGFVQEERREAPAELGKDQED